MNNFKNWRRDNLFLIASISLPLIIVGLFTAATLIPRWLVASPEYDAIFSVSHYDQASDPFGVTFQTEGPRIIATVAYHHEGRSLPKQRLYRTNLADRAATEIAFTIPPDTKARLRSLESARDFVSEDVPVEEAQSLSLIEGNLAPDGYRARNEVSRSGLFGEIFGMRAQHNLLSVEKDGRVISISLPQDSYYRYNKVQLLGWTEPLGKSP